VALVALGAGGLAGCATPYLYDASVETQTKAVSDAWAKVDDGAYFTNLRKAFSDTEVQEDAALTRSLEASRNRNFASYIAPSEAPNPLGRTNVRGVGKLCADVDRRLSQLLGSAYPSAGGGGGATYNCPRIVDGVRLYGWSQLPHTIENYRNALRSDQEDFSNAVAAFVASENTWQAGQKKGKDAPKAPDLPLDCAKIAASPPDIKTMVVPAGFPISDYQPVLDACIGPTGKAGLAKALRDLAPGGSLDTAIGAARGSLISDVFARETVARQTADQSSAAEAVVNAEVSKLEQQIKDASTPSDSEQYADALDAAKKALADAPAAAKLIGAEKVAAFLQDALKAELAKAGQSKATAATDAQSEQPSVTTKRTEAIIQLGNAGAQLADAIRLNNPDQRVSALLIALAAQRQQVDMLRLEAAKQSDDLAVLDAELLGATTDLALLSEARLFLTKATPTNGGIAGLPKRSSRAAAESALNRVALAWSEGRIPMNMARLRHIYLDREYRIKVAETTAENWRGLIKPAIDELQAAGAGGIRPETIANLLGPLGVATVIGVK
jgi:hypothetical protein